MQQNKRERTPEQPQVKPCWETPSVEVVGPVSKIVRRSRSRAAGS